MRKLRCVAIMLLFSLVLVACNAGGSAYLYDVENHTHVYGNRYDVTPLSCVSEGTQIRYCKICHASVTNTVSILEDVAAREHAFSLNVVNPTECEEGYTQKSCTLCDYIIERADVVPALYALLVDANTGTLAPTGVCNMMMSDTATHLLTYDVGRNAAIPAQFARRLAVALTICEEIAREGSTLTAQTEIEVIRGLGAGNRFTVRELLYEWVDSGNSDIASSFAAAIDGTEELFSARVALRLQKLGVDAAVAVDLFSENAPGTATLGATAVMLARALDEPLLVEAFAEVVPGLIRIAGEKPVLYFTDGTLRVSALQIGTGVYRFLLLTGEDAPADLENSLFA